MALLIILMSGFMYMHAATALFTNQYRMSRLTFHGLNRVLDDGLKHLEKECQYDTSKFNVIQYNQYVDFTDAKHYITKNVENPRMVVYGWFPSAMTVYRKHDDTPYYIITHHAEHTLFVEKMLIYPNSENYMGEYKLESFIQDVEDETEVLDECISKLYETANDMDKTLDFTPLVLSTNVRWYLEFLMRITSNKT